MSTAEQKGLKIFGNLAKIMKLTVSFMDAEFDPEEPEQREKFFVEFKKMLTHLEMGVLTAGVYMKESSPKRFLQERDHFLKTLECSSKEDTIN